MDIHRGRRQYRNTRVVTFVARYQLENRTQYKLSYLQRHQLQDEVRASPSLVYTTILFEEDGCTRLVKSTPLFSLSLSHGHYFTLNLAGGFVCEKEDSHDLAKSFHSFPLAKSRS